MNKLALSLLVIVFAGPILAHEGHSHGALSAPHGGAVYDGKKAGVELVQEGNKIKLYPVNGSWKLISVSDVEMAARIEFPKKTPEPLALKKMTDHFAAEIDAKGAYRYQVDLTMTVKGVKESIKFQVEPQ